MWVQWDEVERIFSIRGGIKVLLAYFLTQQTRGQLYSILFLSSYAFASTRSLLV